MNSAVPFLDSPVDGFMRFLNQEFFCAVSIHDRGGGKGVERVGVRGVHSLLFTRALGFPSGSDSKESACKAGDLGSIPGSGRSPGEENGYPL